MAWLKENRLPLSLAAIKFILPFLLQNSVYELHRDEYLYLAEGKHMAWGYMEVPPFLSVLAWISNLFGNGFFWVKFWPALFGALTLFITCKIVKELGGGKFATLVAGLTIICGVFLRTNFLFQPVFLEIFWWTVLAWLLIKYINTLNNNFLYFFGAAAGFSFLSKYSLIFFGAALVLGLLFTKNRKIFLNRHLYYAIALALLIALPNIIWQYRHAWPVLYHMRELRQTQLVYVGPLDFLRDQFLMHTSAFFVWLSGLYFLLFSSRMKNFRFVALTFIFILVLLIISSGKNYYSLGAYPMMFAAGAVALEQWSVRARWLRIATPAFIILLFIFLIPVMLPVWAPASLAAYYQKAGGPMQTALVWEDQEKHPLPQDFADMLGWKEMTQKVQKAYNGIPDSARSQSMILCWNYGQAGAVQYHSKGTLDAQTANASFLFWMPDSLNVKNIILVSDAGARADAALKPYFAQATVVDSVADPFAREHRSRITLLLGADPKVNKLLEMKIAEQKEEFKR